jgi:hemerythrin superfamily protein
MSSPIDLEPTHVAVDILDVLRRDHERVEQLLDEVEATEETDERRRAQLFAQIAAELEVHADAEDQAVYSMLESRADFEDLIDDSRQEHEHIEQMVEELDLTEVTDAEWLQKMRELRQLVRHHVGEEEGVLFPKIRQHLDAGARIRLAGDFLAAKESEEEDELSGERVIPVAPPADVEGMPAAFDPDAESLSKLSKKELYELARSRHIEGRSAMTKAELVDAIRAAR